LDDIVLLKDTGLAGLFVEGRVRRVSRVLLRQLHAGVDTLLSLFLGNFGIIKLHQLRQGLYHKFPVLGMVRTGIVREPENLQMLQVN